MAGARKLGRSTSHRRAMLRAMVTYLLENGKIETTVTRAKEVRSMTEKIITIAKKTDLHSKRQIYAYITKEAVAKKVMDEIAPKYSDRNGGYVRIIKIGPRRGDAAEMAIIELVKTQADIDAEKAKSEEKAKAKKKATPKAKAEEKVEAVEVKDEPKEAEE